jgi:hypothetical protein
MKKREKKGKSIYIENSVENAARARNSCFKE